VTGLFFIVVWQEYVYMSVLFSWIPGIKDTVFPFALGTSELLLVSSIPAGVGAWLRTVVIVMTVGVMILANTNWRVHRDARLNPPQRMVLDDFPRWHGPFGALVAASLQLICAVVLVAVTPAVGDTPGGRTLLAGVAAIAAALYYVRLLFYVPSLRKLAEVVPNGPSGTPRHAHPAHAGA
jgi:hypothetical protein